MYREGERDRERLNYLFLYFRSPNIIRAKIKFLQQRMHLRHAMKGVCTISARFVDNDSELSLNCSVLVFFVGWQVLSNACATFSFCAETKTQETDSKHLFYSQKISTLRPRDIRPPKPPSIFHQMINKRRHLRKWSTNRQLPFQLPIFTIWLIFDFDHVLDNQLMSSTRAAPHPQ